MIKIIVQFACVICVLVVATVASWYEGSALLDNPWEWKYSAPISQNVHGEIQSSSQISQFDFFVYAAKHQPIFPFLMMVSFLYFLILIGYFTLKKWDRGFPSFLICIATMLLLGSFVMKDSPTSGGQLFFVFSIILGVAFIVTGSLILSKNGMQSKAINE
ncbi:YjdJ family protein [Alkalihalobacterium bogoriense]|uniref:YjdJ family protein n=1 Tax=Alkalihalobacterium bogoriense TaxID=246272 RepID=UPI000687A8AC|nr:YjdJ family protein [Alkalihalobacterium bogoriense]